MGTRGQWAIDFAAAVGNSNPTATTVNWIAAWTAKEGTRAKYNPLATTYDLAPNTDFNSVGVKNYETRSQGIDATVRTLRGNHEGYADILQGIITNNPQLSADGLKRAPWGTNGTAVELLWKTADVRDQSLSSEPQNEGSKAHISQVGGNPLPAQSGHPAEQLPLQGHSEQLLGNTALPDEYKTSPTAGELTPAIRTAYVLGGGLLFLVACFLAFKTYVPVTSVVKTVAEVAA